MNVKYATPFLIMFFLSLTGVSILSAQPTFSEKVVLSWGVTKPLTFRGAITYEKFEEWPLYLKLFPLTSEEYQIKSIVVNDPVYQPLDSSFFTNTCPPGLIPDTLAVFHELRVQRKVPSLRITLLPLRKNPVTGAYEKLVSFTLEVTLNPEAQQVEKSSKGYAMNSVLAQGTWYKFAVRSAGIHQLTYDDLKTDGIDVGNIDPRNIRIFGNGGGMLPEANATSRIDDLMENTIFVYGEEDGRFDPGDYILFYGGSPDKWAYNNSDHLFHHQKNIYSDQSFYFLTVDQGQGKRITTQPSSTATPTYYVNRFEDFAFYEKDDLNFIKSGREWWDKENFDITTSRNYAFSFPNIDLVNPVTVTAYVAARSTTGSTSFIVKAQGKSLMSISLSSIGIDYSSEYATEKRSSAAFYTDNPVTTINLVYNKSSVSSVGYLNYLEVNATRLLTQSGSQMGFRSVSGTMVNGVTEFTLNGNGQNLLIWDVSSGGNIRQLEPTKSGNNYIFRVETNTLREFLSFDGGSFYKPEFIARVENQNLHAVEVPDFIIVCHPDFLSQAERLAQFHREKDGFSVFITTPDKIYQEFSSGAQDVTAIRDFVKMLYDKAIPGKEPKYLLLFGDASYDYKNRTNNNTNYVPAFESVNSLSPSDSFISDDYYGKLDASEGQNASGELDLGIGRLPVSSLQQATASVNKILHYCENNDAVKNDWRNVFTFVADDQNEGGNAFIEYSEDLAKFIDTTYKDYNIDKIYSDAYNMISTPGGKRYPEVNEAINKRVEKGCLIMNYIGHGGEVGWAHERILEVPDIKNWSNFNNLPVFVTATCEFSRFDDPERISAGEWVFLNEKGGGVALFTTTRLTSAGPNQNLLVNFYNSVLKQTNGKYLKLGDLLMAAKKDLNISPNIHSFVLLGDPAMQLVYPNLNVVTTSIHQDSPDSAPDTLKALTVMTITGKIADANGNKVENFNGTVFPTVFDKAIENWTKANQDEGPKYPFSLQKNPVYKGQVVVKDGSFSFTFIVPKDIAYQYGAGKISYYARSSETDANGYDDQIQVGGYNNSALPDDLGPEIALYMNDRNFISGGVTDQDPTLLADISDSSGINTVGNGIGHDITIVIDDKTMDPVILNDYYVSNLDTYKSGVITYPLTALEEGEHHLTLKVWDVYNNSSEASISFLVVPSASFALEHLYNFPNPMRDQTTFCWETNQIDQPLEVEIRIFTLNGRLLKTLHETLYSQAFRATKIHWDGTTDQGQSISSGLYVYQLQVMLPDGSAKRQTSKLVVIR
ncbi:MAG: type IX secretion system sortase PorU [Bacteroidales bacterium]|nr:type IX secretion system sortase PorU [Bacteroidales bacterium]